MKRRELLDSGVCDWSGERSFLAALIVAGEGTVEMRGFWEGWSFGLAPRIEGWKAKRALDARSIVSPPGMAVLSLQEFAFGFISKVGSYGALGGGWRGKTLNGRCRDLCLLSYPPPPGLNPTVTR